MLCVLAIGMLPWTLRAAPPNAVSNSAAVEVDEHADVSALEPAKELISTRSLIGLVRDGGIVMFPLAACSFVLLAFVFERAISLRRGRVIPRPFVRRFLHQVAEGELDTDSALRLCEENGSPVAGVFAAAIRKWGRPAVEVEQAIMDSGERAANHLRRYLRVLNGVATVSPLLGLLGTVFGMIRSFNSIASAAAMGKPDLLAHGIGEALITTATGLVIAIPALIAYLWFVSRVDSLVVELDALGQKLVQIISAEGSRPAARTRSRSVRAEAA
ncbi:MAG: MotA/TolQ/ExbB proton channel family protein [Pirellulales bacterium]|nr:MotA/TolQ/ExbB proton channel family protein [Pirellulales bacterium]